VAVVDIDDDAVVLAEDVPVLDTEVVADVDCVLD